MRRSISGVDYELLRGYEILAAEVNSLIGYPATVLREPDPDVPRFRVNDRGDLHYRLEGRDCSAIAEFVLPARARSDGFATSLANSFVKTCLRMRYAVTKVGEVGVYFVRHDKFLRDNLVVSRTHGGGKKLYVLDTIIALRDALSYRYEGAAVDVGLILTWDWVTLQETLSKTGCSVHRFATGSNIRQRLTLAKSNYLLADGVTSFYLSKPESYIDSLAVLPARSMEVGHPEWQLVPREYRYIQPLLRGHDVFMIANRRGELWYFTKDAAIKWVHNRWHRVSAPSLSGLLEQYLPAAAASRIADVVLSLSVHRTGALIVIGANNRALAQGASGGIRRQFDANWVPSVAEMSVEFLSRIAGVDGATLVSPSGFIEDAGLILRVPPAFESTGEGARTAAAAFAGQSGLAIKVSHDGPVSIYDKEGLRLQVS